MGIEVLAGPERRRRWSVEQKHEHEIVAAAFKPDADRLLEVRSAVRLHVTTRDKSIQCMAPANATLRRFLSVGGGRKLPTYLMPISARRLQPTLKGAHVPVSRASNAVNPPAASSCRNSWKP